MSITAFQIWAFLAAVAGMAVVFGVGYVEGQRAAAADHATLAEADRKQIERLRERLTAALHQHEISRHNAAQALEAVTEERDRHAEQATTLQLRLTTAQERLTELAPLALTAEDIVSLRIVNKQLLVAAQTYAGLNLLDQARFASTASERLGQLVDRMAEAMPNTAEPKAATADEASTQERAA